MFSYKYYVQYIHIYSMLLLLCTRSNKGVISNLSFTAKDLSAYLLMLIA